MKEWKGREEAIKPAVVGEKKRKNTAHLLRQQGVWSQREKTETRQRKLKRWREKKQQDYSLLS